VPANAPKVNYRKLNFFDKFFELQGVMWQTNAGLTERHTFDSRPHSWPRLLRGIVSTPALKFSAKKTHERFTEFLG
jgi:dolichyl-phosphate-mannose-protein mannosyltransferase